MHIANQIHNKLMQVNDILIIPHQNPDGDSLGCSTAMAHYLTQRGKRVHLFCVTPRNHRLHFLPLTERIHKDESMFAKTDLILIMDSGDLRYAGVDKLTRNSGKPVVNIDHHPTNEKFGELNWVVPGASSTSEIIYHFFSHNRISINRQMATSLLTGIITDTDNFSNPATSSESLKVAAELLRLGGNFKLINKTVIKNKTVNILKLWGVVFSRLAWHEQIGLAHTYLTREDFETYGVSDSETEGIANFLNNLGEAKIALILKETRDGKIKGSMRTTHDDTDVAQIAKKMGGGGHKKAAGFSTTGTIDEVLERVLSVQGEEKMV